MRKTREADRALWAIKGILEVKILVNLIIDLLHKFCNLDIVPLHYNYPELY